VHDYLQILGLPRHASYREVRRVAARRVRRLHPDFDPGGSAALASADRAVAGARRSFDTAIDFVEVTSFVDGIQAAFFRNAG
jgi:curved DNA-binding protein CbpA